MPDRHKIIVLMTLWGQVCPLKDTTENRAERLLFLARNVGRPVDSTNDLTADELEKCIRALQRETQGKQRTQRKQGKVTEFRKLDAITERQLWKVRQLESVLGWAENPARLDGLLRAKFHESLAYLSHAQAWRAIETLFAIAAREEVRKTRQLRRGEKVSTAELREARTRLKEQLRYWKPEDAASGF